MMMENDKVGSALEINTSKSLDTIIEEKNESSSST
jgi:hypothetical protein